MFRFDQVSVCPGRICVGDHEIAMQCSAICQSHATYGSLVDQNLFHFSIALDLAALAFNQPGHAFDDTACAAHGGPHAETLL